MRGWKELLREHDPAAGVTLAPDIASAMRRRVASSVPSARSGRRWWPEPLGVAAMVVLMIAAGVLAGRRLPSAETSRPELPALADSGERRQLQFSTPGGTRIIWVFDPHFDTNGTIP